METPRQVEPEDLELSGDFENHWRLPQRVHPSVRRIAESLGIPRDVELTASGLLMHYRSLTGRRASTSLILASVILASRFHGVPITIRSVEELDAVSSKALMRALWELRRVSRREDLWDSYLNYVIGNLTRSLNLGRNQHIVRDRLWLRAKRELVRIIRERREEVLGKNPLGLVAVATYLAAKRCGLRGVSLDLLSRCSGLHRNTIYRLHRRIQHGR